MGGTGVKVDVEVGCGVDVGEDKKIATVLVGLEIVGFRVDSRAGKDATSALVDSEDVPVGAGQAIITPMIVIRTLKTAMPS